MPVSGKNIARVLLVRNDRIGDLVLTTPAFRVLREALPDTQIDLLCSAYAEPVVRGNPCLDNILTGRGAHDASDLDELAALIRGRGYDAAVVFVHSRKNSSLVRQAGIPLRIGPWVKLYDPLFFNQPVRQHRSRGEKHEAAYNIDLLAKLGIEIPEKMPLPEIVPDMNAVERSVEFLLYTFNDYADNLVVVHPGMGGSALNWPESRWRELLQRLAARSEINVAVTGAESERELVQRVIAPVAGLENVKPVLGLELEEFIGLLSMAAAVVAPSTGPLHLAAALGMPRVAGIYSPVPAHHPRRWGPLGSGEIRTFLPEVACPARLACLGEKCPEYDCMEKINVITVYEYLIAILHPEMI